MSTELPFVVEYAKSGRASCKKCKENISKDSVRMAIMVQSPFFDGKMPMWHHLKCFFEKKNTLKSTTDIANFDNLRWEDQETIKKKLGSVTNGAGSSSSGNSDFSVEYAKSNKSTCRGCSEKIDKGTVRISKLDDSPDARYGPAPLWHHVDCFVEKKQELGYTDAADKLPGYDKLFEEDKNMLNAKIGKGVKRKAENEGPSPSKLKKSIRKEDKVLKAQSDLLFSMRDNLKKEFDKKELISLLEHNDQHIPHGEARLVDHLSDCLVFGAIKECPDCKSARPRFLNNSYVCPGHLTEWTKCEYVTTLPEREEFIVPEDFRENYSFLKKYKYVKRDRVFPKIEAEAVGKTKKLPLYNFKIAVIGKFEVPVNVVHKKIEELGGTVLKQVSKSVNICISTPAEAKSNSKKLLKVQQSDIHVVSYGFLEAVRKGSPVAQSMKENLLCDWGGDPILKYGIKREHEKIGSKEECTTSKSVPQTIKVSAQGYAGVDPDSGLGDVCHVYQKKKDIFNVVLAYVDMSKGTNSFYKLQLLKANTGAKCYVFRAWGRVGTSIGGKKVDNFDSLEAAQSLFEEMYEEKTGNSWWDRNNFVKKPGCMYPLDIDYGQECKELQQQLKPGKNSKLLKPVQELICLLFDIEAMKKAMVEFEIDLKKMPLGKLSKKQIDLAYKVLCEAQQILVTGSNPAKIKDVTNRFFTLIPHDFGMKNPPLLDYDEIIKAKIEMLDSLMEIEFAFNLIKGEHDKTKDPVDEHYEKLKTDINVLKKGSSEYKFIDTYLKNTHAQTHNQYVLELDEVFKISRHGEDERYKEFKGLHNKKLLWHGSRLTNYVGILSQGLRIAPPEAPTTGYMFGKGIYFADMVSKSANYCFTSKSNPTGLMLLCEVALGDMYEKTTAEYIQKLPKNKHSTLGMGQTMPDPKQKTFVGDVEIPYGKPIPRPGFSLGHLLYNEYIVYDVNQVNIKYLLKVNFKWRH